MSAQIQFSKYQSSGEQYFIVVCEECKQVLNSGHHFPNEYYSAANSCAKIHNDEFHSKESNEAVALF